MAICLVIVGIGLSEVVYAQSIKTPEARVKSFYSWYLRSLMDGPDSDKAIMSSHLSKRLNRWFNSKAGQNLDYDIFTNGQDFNDEWVNHIIIDKVTTVGAKATVNITLGSPNNDWNMLLTISLIKENSMWKIDRVRGTRTAR